MKKVTIKFGAFKQTRKKLMRTLLSSCKSLEIKKSVKLIINAKKHSKKETKEVHFLEEERNRRHSLREVKKKLMSFEYSFTYLN